MSPVTPVCHEGPSCLTDAAPALALGSSKLISFGRIIPLHRSLPSHPPKAQHPLARPARSFQRPAPQPPLNELPSFTGILVGSATCGCVSPEKTFFLLDQVNQRQAAMHQNDCQAAFWKMPASLDLTMMLSIACSFRDACNPVKRLSGYY